MISYVRQEEMPYLYRVGRHRIGVCNCLPKTQQPANTNSGRIGCDSCPMSVDTAFYCILLLSLNRREASIQLRSEGLMNDGLNYKDPKVAKL